MKIARFSVNRPIFTTMVTLIVVILGGVALTRLPIDLMPEMTYPTLSISTSYSNASPEEMETLVTRFIEQAVAAVPGVEEITSSSAEGSSSVRVSFNWGVDLDVASNDIRDRLDRIANDLPDDVDRPQLRKFDLSAFPVVILGISSRLDPIELRQLIDDQIQYRLERTDGVAAAEVWGGLEREVQVNLDPEKIKALGLPLDTVVQAIRSANVNVPAGHFERGQYEVTVRTPGEFTKLEELERTVVASREGVPIYLNQIANVADTHARISRIIRINNQEGVRMAIRKQSGTNTVQVADGVLKEVERLNAEFPQINVVPVIDSSLYIRRSINNVAMSIMYGGGLAIFVLLFFLRNIRSTLVVATAIPISIIASFALIYFGGFTLNLMTLGGLALGVGMMVDNAIVVLENIFRVNKEIPDAAEASIVGTEEVTAAVIASTVTTLVIFVPMLFIEGMAGIMFKQLAYVISFSLICSLAVALTLIPVLSSGLLRGQLNAKRTGPIRRLIDKSERAFEALENLYKDMLYIVLRARLATCAIVLLIFGGVVLLIPYVGTEFLPATDEGEVRVSAEMEVGTRLEIVDAQMRKIEQIVYREVPEIKSTSVSVGASGWRPGGASTGDMQVALVNMDQRTRSSEDIATDLRKELGTMPGLTIRTRASQGMVNRRLSGGDEGVEIEVRGYDIRTLDALAQEVRKVVEEIPGITDVRMSREAGILQEMMRIDRDRAADLGLSVQQVANGLETALAGSRAGQYRERGNEFPILVKMENAERLSMEEILDLTVTNASGDAVVLRNVVNVDPERGPIQVERKNQERVANVSANVSGRALGDVIADVQTALRQIPTPAGYALMISGDYEEQQESFRELALGFVLAIVLVFMVLACLYESLRDPIVVMFSVPLAAIGVVITLYLTNTTFNAQSFIGCIMLGGIVVNNAILIVDQAAQLDRGQGMKTHDAVVEAGRRRLRPILMTTLTTLLGLLPLALGIGEGAEAQAPLARAVIGGLFSSTLITLFLIPVIYSLIHPDRSSESPAEEPEPAGLQPGRAT